MGAKAMDSLTNQTCVSEGAQKHFVREPNKQREIGYQELWIIEIQIFQNAYLFTLVMIFQITCTFPSCLFVMNMAPREYSRSHSKWVKNDPKTYI